jgi:hypothetical protein
MEKKFHSSDPLEISIAKALTEAGIEFIHESQNNGSRLDFYLPYYDVYIEAKSGFSERTASQMQSKQNVIIVQGVKSTNLIVNLIAALGHK